LQSAELNRRGIFLCGLSTEKRRKIIHPRNETLKILPFTYLLIGKIGFVFNLRLTEQKNWKEGRLTTALVIVLCYLVKKTGS